MLKILELDNLILSQLSDKDVDNYTYINRSCFLFCNDEFWEKRTLKKYPKFQEIQKNKTRSWRLTCNLLNYYSENYKPDTSVKRLAVGGIDFVDLIDYFILLGANNLNKAILISQKKKHKELEEYLKNRWLELNKK